MPVLVIDRCRNDGARFATFFRSPHDRNQEFTVKMLTLPKILVFPLIPVVGLCCDHLPAAFFELSTAVNLRTAVATLLQSFTVLQVFQFSAAVSGRSSMSHSFANTFFALAVIENYIRFAATYDESIRLDSLTCAQNFASFKLTRVCLTTSLEA